MGLKEVPLPALWLMILTIIVVGCDDSSITSGVNRVIEAKGGLVFADNYTAKILELPVAGLISDQRVEDVAER